MHALLQRFGIKRGDVELWAARAAWPRRAGVGGDAAVERHRAMARPAGRAGVAEDFGGMANLAVIAAANPEMEALAIAVAMREARHLDKSAALVTPDRALARRVMAALGRWNLLFDDSGGDALMDTSAGIFARLAAEAVANQLEPPTLLALLKHPLCGSAARRRAQGARSRRWNWRCCAARGRRPGAAASRGISTLSRRARQTRAARHRRCMRSEPRTSSDEELDRASD